MGFTTANMHLPDSVTAATAVEAQRSTNGVWGRLQQRHVQMGFIMGIH